MYCEAHQLEDIVGDVKTLNPQKNDAIFLAFGEETTIDYPSLVKALDELDIHFFGGVFPSIIHEMNTYKTGCIIKKIPTLFPPVLMKHVSSGQFNLPDVLSTFDRNVKPAAFLFVDGLTTNISGCLEYLHNHFGNDLGFIGGGAGSLSLKQQPCLFNNEGFFEDAAIICITNMSAGLGVKHGWQKIAGPFVATKTDQNTIFELNWQNAFEVYKEYIKEDSGQEINDDNFFDIAKGYPFGMFKEGQEEVVRDPLFKGENGELICVGDVPENTVLYIMKGVNEHLVSAAHSAVEQATEHNPGTLTEALVVDCISRTLFLEDNFTDELGAIRETLDHSNKGIVSEGVLSLGEISSYGNDYLVFFNKTLVVGVFNNIPG